MHNSLSFCLYNSRSLTHKLTNFQSFVYTTCYNIYCITETWPSDLIFDYEILPTSYTLYRKDRKSRGGGILIAVDSSVSSILSHSPADLEVITIKVGTQKSIITVCAVYVPPNIGDNYQNVLLSYLTEMVSTSDHIIIVGDFNIYLIFPLWIYFLFQLIL